MVWSVRLRTQKTVVGINCVLLFLQSSLVGDALILESAVKMEDEGRKGFSLRSLKTKRTNHWLPMGWRRTGWKRLQPLPHQKTSSSSLRVFVPSCELIFTAAHNPLESLSYAISNGGKRPIKPYSRCPWFHTKARRHEVLMMMADAFRSANRSCKTA